MTPTARVAMVGVSSALYLGLAILGWGGFAAFFSHEALIALTAAFIIVCIAALFAGGNISPGEHEDRGNRWVLVAFTVLGLLNGWLPAYTDRNEIWTIDGDAVRWIGVVVFIARQRLAALARLRPWQSLQRPGRHPTWA